MESVSEKDSIGWALQNRYLNFLRKERIGVTVFLTSGIKLQGLISAFDNFCIFVSRGDQSQLVYKHAIASISSSDTAGAFNPSVAS